MKKIKRRFKYWLLRLAIKYILYSQRNSNYIKYAIKEFDYSWKDWKNDEMQSLMCNQVIELLALLSTQGDSGFSIGYKEKILTRVMMFKPITKLTFKDDEFHSINNLGFDTDFVQNKRNSSVFKYNDGTIVYINAYSKHECYYIGEKLEILKKDRGHCSGQLNILKPNGEIYRIQYGGVIKDLENFSEKTFSIPVYAIEYPKDWWTHLAKEEDLVDYLKEYDIRKINNTIDTDLDYKDGIFRQDILKRIELIKNHK